MEEKEAPRFHVYYGHENTQLDVTFDALFTHCDGKRISIPATNQEQDLLFSDPCPGIVKKITIRENDDVYDFADGTVVHDCKLNGEMLYHANMLRKRTKSIDEFVFLLVLQCHCRTDHKILKIGTQYNVIDTTTTTSVPEAESTILVAFTNDYIVQTPKNAKKVHCEKKVWSVQKLQKETKQVFHTIVFESAKSVCIALKQKVDDALQNVSCVIVQIKSCPSDDDTAASALLMSHSFFCHFLCGKDVNIRVFLRRKNSILFCRETADDLTQTLQHFCTDYSNVLIVGCKNLQLPCSSLAHFTIVEKDNNTLVEFESRHKKNEYSLLIQKTFWGELTQSEQQKTQKEQKKVYFHVPHTSHTNVYNTLVFETLHGLELFLQIGLERLADANKIIFKCNKLDHAQYMQGILQSLQFYTKQIYVYRNIYSIFVFHKQVDLS